MKSSLVSALVSVVLLAGCGGGGGGGSTGTPSRGKVVLGDGLTAEAFVTGSPITVNGTGASFIGLTGLFDTISWSNPNPRNEQSLVVYSIGDQVRVMDYDGNNDRLVWQSQSTNQALVNRVFWNPFGGTIYFVHNGQLLRIGVGGGTTTVIRPFATQATVSGLGDKIYYVNDNTLYRCNLDGSAPEFVSGGSGVTDVLQASSRRLFAYRSNLNESTEFRTPDLLHVNTWVGKPIAGTRGNNHALLYRGDNGGNAEMRFLQTWFTDQASDMIWSNMVPIAGAGSADDREVVILDRSGTNYRIARRSLSGVSNWILRSWPEREGVGTSVDVQPRILGRLLSGIGSSFAWTAHGVVWGNRNKNASGLGLVRVSTPSSVKMSAGEPSAAGTNVYYTVEGDRIIKLAITVDKVLTLRDITLGSTVNGVIFNFDGGTGEVVNALTYTVTRSEGKPTIKHTGDRTKIEGSILQVIDRYGNVTNENVSSVELAPTGKVLSAR